MTFGEYLKLQMNNLEIGQTQVMEHCNVSKTSVSKWMNDHVLPNIVAWHRLAVLLSKRSKLPLSQQLFEMSETLPINQ